MESLPVLYAVGFYPWKKRILRAFRPQEQIKFLRSPQFLPQKAELHVAAWGLDFPAESFPKDAHVTRYEDGFIRSVGLGAAFAPAYSWVADRTGIYFDARLPSDLEIMLQRDSFPSELIERAQSLHDKILKSGITKYNLPAVNWTRPPSAKKVILVPGQVETDSSILYGSPLTRSNIALLQTVRGLNSDAYVIYKPHPDVVSGRRRQGLGENKVSDWCDEIVTSASMDHLLATVDEVHVMTSLAGFEAMLRSKRVVTYGQPFYAGWGLTEDRCPPPRRTRKLHLSELIAGALIKYPLYLSPQTNCPCEAEHLIDELRAGAKNERLSLSEKILRHLSAWPLWAKYVAK